MRSMIFCSMILCLVFLVGCGKSELDWINNPPQSSETISAVGTAPYSPMTYIMRDGAEVAARSAIARVVGTRVQEVIKRWAEENHSSITNTPTFNTYFSSAVQAIVDQDLPGARITKWYYDEDARTQFALAEFKISDAAKLAKTEIKKTQKQIESENKVQTVFSSPEEARRAFSELDQLIEQEFIAGS